MIRLSLISTGLTLMLTAQAAESPEKLVSTYGIGGKSTCGAFVRSLGTPEYNRYFDYAAGFITGQNMRSGSGGDVLGGADLNDAMLLVEKYCRENPMTGFINGLYKLVSRGR